MRQKFSQSEIVDAAQLALEKSMCEVAGTAPKNFHVSAYWRDLWGRSESTTRQILRARIADGRMEKKIFRVELNGRLVISPHYRAIK